MKSLKLALCVAVGLASPFAAQAQDYKLPFPVVAEETELPRQSVDVLDSTMSYLEVGAGAPVLFIHGNPTSSYLWRNVMPFVADTNRAIALDLIGMGNSAKPEITYDFADHARYLDGFVEALDLTDITLVGHDWGAALAWDFARRNPDKVVRLAFMEGVLPPAFPQSSYEAMGEEFGNMFHAMRDPEMGRQMIMVENSFVNQILPAMVNRSLGKTATAAYAAPYPEEADRLPTWMWPREVPIGGEPASNVELMNLIQAFMGETGMPVLLTYAEPGVLVPPQALPYYTGLIENLETSFVGQGLHFIQEDQPDAIGRALRDWMRRN
ncbi:haloalkane dehalogenase [Epibacterium sp. SM1979]|uniref:Haloalkane dehalogenase n=1 Tax=Tritonibacter litoralis TaxID=2662264 RepID=A0A843YKU7_9RHOB|nr:haloalkane dehalogenase [Tritonibacter litoralis]MQQ10295.1 haloalkane dehalogenase [Tritonibacter litoralis]